MHSLLMNCQTVLFPQLWIFLKNRRHFIESITTHAFSFFHYIWFFCEVINKVLVLCSGRLLFELMRQNFELKSHFMMRNLHFLFWSLDKKLQLLFYLVLVKIWNYSLPSTCVLSLLLKTMKHFMSKGNNLFIVCDRKWESF